MMRALFSGVTGLKTHQTRMDVIGNNIANVNTLGFKKSAANFADLYSETVTPASAPSATQGGINAQQVGLGVNVNSCLLYTSFPLPIKANSYCRRTPIRTLQPLLWLS